MNREKVIVRTSLVGILGNILLVAAKAIIGFFSCSFSIIMDAVNNLSDALSSVITIIGTKLSNKKPDKKHPYGHGRVEYLTSLIIAVIILVAGGSAIYESIRSLIEGSEANYSIYSLIVISIAILVKILLGLFFRIMGKKTNSEALKASGVDALFDSLLSLSTLVGALVALYAHVSIEGYLGILIGLFIIKSGVEILMNAVSSLIGKRADKELAVAIKQVVNSFPEVIGAYDLIVHDYGPTRSIASIHIEVRDSLTAKEIHPLTRKISQAVYEKFGTILTVGIYATNESNPEIKQIRKDLYELVKNYPTIQQIHGFYVDIETKIITFDIIVDYQDEDMEKTKNELLKAIKNKHPEYNYYAILDNDFAD